MDQTTLNATVMAAVPLGLTAAGWLVIKVIKHETWLCDIRAQMQRIEDKVDRLVDRL